MKYRLDDQRRRVVQSLSGQYATLAAIRERLPTAYRELSAMAVAAEAMSKRMLSGNQSLLDLLDVYDRFYQARVRLVNLHTQEMGSVAQVIRLVQGIPQMAAPKLGGSPAPATPLAANAAPALPTAGPDVPGQSAEAGAPLRVLPALVRPRPTLTPHEED